MSPTPDQHQLEQQQEQLPQAPGLLEGVMASVRNGVNFVQTGMTKIGAVKDGVANVLDGAKDAKVEWDNAANNNAAFKNVYLVREAAGNVRLMDAKEYNQKAHLVTVLEINGKPVTPQSNRSTWAA